MFKTITIDELEIGMYVKDVVWNNSQYKVKTRGLVKSAETIKQLRQQGVASLVVAYESALNEARTSSDANQPPARKKAAANDEAPPLSQNVEDEFARSCEIYDEATEHVKEMFLNASAGQNLTPEAISTLAGEITESVARNEYAMTILTRIRHHSTYQWEHSINSGVLMCGFCLFLGIKKEVVEQITLGAMLHDVGTAKIPKGIIDKPGTLTNNEMTVVKKHVVWGYDICKRDGFDAPVIIDMVVNHHERLNGSGYPRGISKDKISKLSRMIAIVDVYDAMTGDSAYKKGVQPIEALRYLISQNELFDQDLVQKFIKYIGVNPVGSLVKLSSEMLAIVIEGNREEPLKPIVKVFYSLKLNCKISPKSIDLTVEPIEIIASVKGEEYNINIAKVIRDIVG
ncbi:HD-GYP domain-containing protein [Thalassotalea fusca]